MSRKISFVVVSVLFGIFALTAVCEAFTLLTKEQALQQVFPGCEIANETKRLKGPVLSKVKKRLGGSLVFFQEGSESARVSGKKTIEFYVASKNGKKVGVAIIDVEPGKWGPVEFIIALNLRGVVQDVRVMSYQEKRGRPIARLSFMRQYTGKSSKSVLRVGRDIVGVSGATISSRAATFAVKKAIVLYEELYRS